MVTIRSGKNITHSDQIGDDVIIATDIAPDAVDASEIAADAVRASEIQAGAVGTSEVADNTLTTDDLGAGSVGTSEIVDESVSQADMEDGTAGDLAYYTTGGEYARLPKGTALQALRMNAGGTLPEWADPASAYGQLDLVTLGAGATTLTTNTFTAKTHLRLIIFCEGSASANLQIQFNGDTGNNYNGQVSTDFATPTAHSAQASLWLEDNVGTGERYAVIDILNYSAQAKRIIGKCTKGLESNDISGHWTNVAAQITSITLKLSAAGDITAGTKLIVLGMD